MQKQKGLSRRDFTTTAIMGAMAIGAGLFSPSELRAQQTTTIRLADQPGAEACYAAVWVAEALGYFDQEGIKLDRRTFPNGPAALLEFPNQSIDAVMGGVVPFMQFAARGGEFKLVMSVTKGNAPLVGLKKYSSYKDLQGRPVGSPGPGTIQDAILSYVEQTQGIRFKRVFGRVTDFAVMAERGEVDAFISWEPAAAAAMRGNPQLHYVAQMPPIANAESLGVIFQPKIAAENPDLIVRFTRATLRGMEFIKSNPPVKTAELVARKMNDPGAVSVVDTAMKSLIVTEPRLDMPSMRTILQTIANQGRIPAEFVKDVDGWVGTYVDYSFLEKAEAGLERKKS